MLYALITVKEHNHTYEVYKFDEPYSYAHDPLNGNPYLHSNEEIKNNPKLKVVDHMRDYLYNLYGVHEFHTFEEIVSFLQLHMGYTITGIAYS